MRSVSSEPVFGDQVEAIVRALFAPVSKSPFIPVIDEDKLPDPVRVERVTDDDEFFSHIYGALPVAAVSNVLELRRDPDTSVSPALAAPRLPATAGRPYPGGSGGGLPHGF